MTGTSRSSKHFFIFSILSALFTLSMFYRVSSAVIAPDLMRDLGLNAENLGMLGGAFFYSFALLQIPMGPMLDRIGPRIVIDSFSMIGALGALVSACDLRPCERALSRRHFGHRDGGCQFLYNGRPSLFDASHRENH